MSDHAPLPPSGANLWGNCSASIAASRGVPNFGSDETEEGTAAHWCVSETLIGWQQPHQTAVLECEGHVGRSAPNGVVVDDEMARCAQVMVDEVVQLCHAEHVPLSAVFVEKRVYMPRIHPDNWGTLDAAVPLFAKRKLVLMDYKHGHRFVPARNNLQLIDYAEGLLQKLGMSNFDTVEFRIVRPRCYMGGGPVDTWTCAVVDLYPVWQRLSDMAYAAMSGAGACTTGEWCRDCPGLPRCQAARLRDYNLIDYVGAPLVLDDMTPAEMAVEREILAAGMAAAKKRAEAIDAQLIHAISQGADCPLTVESKPGRVKWAKPPAVVIACAAQFGADASEQGVKTPPQVAALVKKEMRFAWQEAAKSLTTREAGSLTLVPREESRVARAFGRK